MRKCKRKANGKHKIGGMAKERQTEDTSQEEWQMKGEPRPTDMRKAEWSANGKHKTHGKANET